LFSSLLIFFNFNF